MPIPDFSRFVIASGNKKGGISAECTTANRFIMPFHESIFGRPHMKIPENSLAIVAARSKVCPIGTESTAFDGHLVSSIYALQCPGHTIPELEKMIVTG